MPGISVFDIFKIGVGPSSSHTMGPWKAALSFLQMIDLDQLVQIKVCLYGSLSKTGVGHGTDIAVMLGLAGYHPESIPVDLITSEIDKIKQQLSIHIANKVHIPFNPEYHIEFNHSFLDYHPNGMRFEAFYANGTTKIETYYSIGGGFIEKENSKHKTASNSNLFPYPINTESDLIKWVDKVQRSIQEIVLQNELYLRDEAAVYKTIYTIWHHMEESIYRGCHTTGILPGGLNVVRRAAKLHRKLIGDAQYENLSEWKLAIQTSGTSFSKVTNWVSCFALAVNEENAAFGRVVTAPTNGAAGVIPAVLMYYLCFCENKGQDDIADFLLIAGEIGSLFKKGATISAAQGGCQAEIGVSSSMAAAALCTLLGGSPRKAMTAAEIAMEHHLGMTCDPIGGLVQIPCIERNAMGAMKAITAAHLALNGEEAMAKVSLDNIIETMWETAQDMNTKYKETSEGGLANCISVGLADC